jgi:hypothetical protein
MSLLIDSETGLHRNVIPAGRSGIKGCEMVLKAHFFQRTPISTPQNNQNQREVNNNSKKNQRPD